MIIHYAQILCSCGAGGGGAQAKEAVVCHWWRMKVFEKSGELTDKARKKKKPSVLITQQTGLELQMACCLSLLLSSVSEVLLVGSTVSSSQGAAGLWIVKCRILAGSQIYGPDFVPLLLLNG